MRLAAAPALLALLGCASLLGDPDRVIALEIVGGTARTITVGQSVVLLARPVTARGDTVPGASGEIAWAVLDTGLVGFTLEPGGKVTGTAQGKGRVQARYQEIRSDPISITVIAATP